MIDLSQATIQDLAFRAIKVSSAFKETKSKTKDPQDIADLYDQLGIDLI